MSNISLHLRSLRNFSLPESLRILLAIPIRKAAGIASSYTLFAKSTFDFLLKGQQKVTKEGDLNKIALDTQFYPRPVHFYTRRKTTDIIIFKEILYQKEYRYLVELQQKLGCEIRYIVDAGANIGTATVYLKSVFPDASIVSIEPEDGNFKILQRNIAVNEFTNVTPFKGGLWNKETWLEVRQGFRGEKEKELSFYVEELDESNKTENSISGITVDGIKKKYGFPRIDILKIDIEGAERYLFDTLEATKFILKDVRILAIEVHEEVMDKWKLVDYLEQAGYRQITYGEILYAYKEL